LSSLTNPDAYQVPDWCRIHADLETYSFDKHVFSPNVYRKGWEWTQAVYGLERLGAITSDATAIGVGAGRECVIFWLGDHIGRVVATDLYGNEEWTSGGGREADAAVLENPQQFCPRPINASAIEFRTMNGLALEYPDESFDIAWSLSSIEHFGGHDNAAMAVREMSRVLRPGGVAAIATECLLLDDQESDEYFTRGQIEEFVINATPSLELVEPVDWSLPAPDYLIDSVVVPGGAGRFRRHVVLNNGLIQWTSILVFLRKRIQQ
jgi:SAM-dependent methyltransferase